VTPTRKIWVLCVHLTPVALSVTAVCALGVWVTGEPLHPPTVALLTVVGLIFAFWSACFDRSKSWHEAMGWEMRPTVEEVEGLRAERDGLAEQLWASAERIAIDESARDSLVIEAHKAFDERDALKAEVKRLRGVINKIDDIASEGVDTHPIGLSNPRVQDCNKALLSISTECRAALSQPEHNGMPGHE
jgi:hypothetical protein